jgi:hypothetical protein
MPIEAPYLAMMPTTVTIFSQTSSDKYGKPTYSGTGTQVKCRVVPANKTIRTATGVDVVANGTIYFYGTPTVTVDSKILLPNLEMVFVIDVKVQNDESGSHHTAVNFGSGR